MGTKNSASKFACPPPFNIILQLPYGGKLWRVQTLAEWQGKHHWRNKLWRIDDKSLIKRILKQFEYKSTHNWSIRVHMFANQC